MSSLRSVAKAIAAGVAAGVGAAASYLITAIGAEGGLSDLSAAQWLGLVPIVLAVYGITWVTPNVPTVRSARDDSTA